MPLNFTPTSFDTLPLALVDAVSTLSNVWGRLEELRTELTTAQGTIRSVLATAGPTLSSADQAQLSFVLTRLYTQQNNMITRQAEVSAVINQVDVVKNLIHSFAPEVLRLQRDEQANYERNHELQEQLNEIQAELKERGIVL